MDFKIGDILRAYNKNSVAVTNVYSAYNITNGLLSNTVFLPADLVKQIPNGNTFGIIQEIDNVNNIALVALSIQVYKFGKQISHGYVSLSRCEKINAITSTGKRYFATIDALNIRDKPSLLSTVRSKALKGDYLGFSDGIADKNGYCRFQLAIGGIGYISAKYISLTKPARTVKVITNNDNSITEQTTIPYSPNEKAKFGLFALLGLAVGFYGYKKMKK
jgi:hypothetical protein